MFGDSEMELLLFISVSMVSMVPMVGDMVGFFWWRWGIL